MMKKYILAVLCMLFLAGCTSDQSVSPETTESDSTHVSEGKEGSGDQSSEDDKATPEQHVGLESYEEYDMLSEKIDLTKHQVELTTDNPGKRILLFADADGKKIYKSIFSKHDNHLKIIQLDDEGLLFNGRVN